MIENSPPDRPRDSLWMGLFAMVAFTLWGLYVNWDYGLGSRIQVALTQGILGLTSTFFSAEIVVWLVRLFKEKSHPVILAGASSWIMIYTIIGLVHLLAGTPEIFMTILPGMITGVFFSFGYAKRVTLYLRPRS